jgi:CRISPR/Cas system-associated exonuclease Cas4 (RecB family)
MTIPTVDISGRASAQQESTTSILQSITADRFEGWYRERKFRQNIREGKPYFNGSSPVPPSNRHSPSSLLQCHRKIVYRQENAPEERPDPKGIFWVGSRFEEELALPFLQDTVTGTGAYACNSLWVDFTVETNAGELRIKGETDPCIVDAEGEPLLLTEIKTKQSVENVDVPNRHHRAQAHAYMWGLSEKYDRSVTDAVILYGGRTSLDVRCFHVEFDPEFWTETVLEWAAQHTMYRLDRELPPPDPAFQWECEFCSYRERCGQGETSYTDVDSVGLLPGLTEYPRVKLVEYLDAYPEAKLTPELAGQYPELARSHGAYDWVCEACAKEWLWDGVDWDDASSGLPDCPRCAAEGIPASLGGPSPPVQRERMGATVNA